jgi:hypothetical protein
MVVKGNDLVVSTQGRAFWILDDISPLRQMSPDVSLGPRLFKPSPALRFFSGGGFGQSRTVGQNPPNGAVIYYVLPAEPKEKEEVTLEFLDSSGKVVRKLSNREREGAERPAAGGGGEEEDFFGPRGPRRIPAKAGLNRFAWDLRGEEASRFRGMILWGGGTQGPVVPPGTYQAKLTSGGQTLTQGFEVKPDPRLTTTQADYDQQYALLAQVRDKLTETHDAIARIREVRDQVKGVSDRTKGNQAIADAADALNKKLTAVEEELYQTKNQSSQDPLNFPIRLNNKLSALAGVVAGADAPPTDQSLAVYQDIAGRIDAQLARLREVVATDVPAFNKLVREQDVPAIVVREKREGRS